MRRKDPGARHRTGSPPGENLPGLMVVPRIANRKLHLGTLLGVICSQILVELGVLVELFATMTNFNTF